MANRCIYGIGCEEMGICLALMANISECGRKPLLSEMFHVAPEQEKPQAEYATPISDALMGKNIPHVFSTAEGRTLMRRLERERAECLLLLASVARVDAEAVASLEALGVDVPEQSRVIGREAARLVATFKLTV